MEVDMRDWSKFPLLAATMQGIAEYGLGITADEVTAKCASVGTQQEIFDAMEVDPEPLEATLRSMTPAQRGEGGSDTGDEDFYGESWAHLPGGPELFKFQNDFSVKLRGFTIYY